MDGETFKQFVLILAEKAPCALIIAMMLFYSYKKDKKK